MAIGAGPSRRMYRRCVQVCKKLINSSAVGSRKLRRSWHSAEVALPHPHEEADATHRPSDTRHPRAAVHRTAAVMRMLGAAEIEAAISRLEGEMSDLQHRHRDLFAYANAWAERYDAIVFATPIESRAAVEARLNRIGVRWGVANGVRMTGQFPALDPA
ncbi:MAG: hypothetical protein KY442_01300 [Proteobacteria bacterium]|nr:hypothetical protein [Pseudomonadota bacterium]